MTTKERLALFAQNMDRISMVDTPLCINCEYFIQHYIKGKTVVHTFTFKPIDFGHCTHKNPKSRKAWDACEHFERRKGKTP